jgi:RNA polymerase sigma-70 factor (ECF subfamily)
MSATPTGDPQFHTTHWSLIAAAAGESGETTRAALEELCHAYWYPLYAFIRRRGHSPDDARDLAQEFFATLLERGYLSDADPDRGRFRSFLLTAAARFVAKERDKAAAQKRGGGKKHLSLDFADGESRYQREPADNWTPERIFERRWALTLLERTIARMRQDYEADGKLSQFDILKVYLTGESGAPPLRQVAEQLETTEGAVKAAVHRLRHRYRDLLREEIAQTVAAKQDIDDELAVLLSALRGT